MCHFLDLPGATFKCRNEETALALAPQAARDELAWLGERVPDHPSVVDPVSRECVVAGRVVTTALAGSSDTEAFFDVWVGPLTSTETRHGLSYMRVAREALISEIMAMPTHRLDLPPAHGKRTILQVLRHVAQAQLWYVSRLKRARHEVVIVPQEAESRPEESLHWLHLAQTAFEAAIAQAAQSAPDCTAMLDPHAERWTASKVLYRGIWHDRHHLRAIVESLIDV